MIIRLPTAHASLLAGGFARSSLIALLALLAGSSAAQGQQKAERFAGEWAGAIQTPNAALDITVHLSAAAASLVGTIDIPAQGATAVALGAVETAGDSLRFMLTGVPGDPSFSGLMRGDTIRGAFTQGALGIPFYLIRAGHAAAPPAKKPGAR
jgi:hypothetical protein